MAIGKVGSKGELYPPKKIRDGIGLKPEVQVEFIVTPNGELIIRKIEKLEDILKPIAKVKQDEFEELSESMQNQED